MSPIAQLQSTYQSEIGKICEEREITNLVHFTHICNLSSILRHGLLGRSQLESMLWGTRPHFNDELRLDGQKQAICLSVSFPNYQMFFKYSSQTRSDWVVLLLKTSILWEMDCKFYRENAASNSSRGSVAADRRGADAFQYMFEDYGQIQRHMLGIPSSYTTHPQAEVLVLQPIPASCIKVVHFYSPVVRLQWSQAHPGNYPQAFDGYNKEFFFPRCDHKMWQTRRFSC